MSRLFPVTRVLVGCLALPCTFILNGSVNRQDPILAALRAEGNLAFTSGKFKHAISIYRTGFETAAKQHAYRQQVLFLNNLASSHLVLEQFSEALDVLLKAATVADSHGLVAEQSSLAASLAGLYARLGDLEAADRFAELGLSTLGRADPHHVRHELISCRALFRSQDGHHEEAVSEFLEAINDAAREVQHLRDPRMARMFSDAISNDWDLLAAEMLARGDFVSANSALNEALRVNNVFHGLGLQSSLFWLAWLRLEQNRFAEAESLMRRAEAMPLRDTVFHSWFRLYIHGRILQGQGDHRAALDVMRRAFLEARECQTKVAPTGVIGSFAQVYVRDLYRDIIELSLSLDKSGKEAFVFTEEDRANSLRQSVSGKAAFLKKAPREYWEALGNLRKADAAEMASSTPATREAAAQLRQTVSEMETRTGLSASAYTPIKSPESNTDLPTLRGIQESIRPDEALLAFRVGREFSALWAVTNNRFQLYRLPKESELSGVIGEFQKSVEQRRPDRDALGSAVFEALFGRLDPAFQGKPVWSITAEDSFFKIPMAALVAERRQGKAVYLIERHTILYTPSAALWTKNPKPASAGPFLGMGDGVYNVADTRYKTSTRSPWSPFMLFASNPPLELPRLAGSGKELESCSRIWNDNKPAALLTGMEANGNAFRDAIRSKPEVIHIASHFLNPPNRGDEAVIDLGLDSHGTPEIINETDIASFHVPGSTVVMSGCNSGNSRSIPTAGVLGLIRAWLLAGARAVIGSRWPVPDDTGELFRSFYTSLRARKSDPARMRAVAASLRDAQLTMLYSGTWRSDPLYWGAFYIVGKE